MGTERDDVYRYVHEVCIEFSTVTGGKVQEFDMDIRGYCVECNGHVECEFIQIGSMESDALMSVPPGRNWIQIGGGISDEYYEIIIRSRYSEMEK